MLTASYKSLMGSKSVLCTRPDILQIQQKEFDLHKARLNDIKRQRSFTKKYIDIKPMEIRHNVKTDAIKANEDYARLNKNSVIYERLRKLSKPVKSVKKQQKTVPSEEHINGYLVNRKKEAKRIEEENNRIYRRMKTLKTKPSVFSIEKYKKHLEKYEKTLSLRKKKEGISSTIKIIVTKDNKNSFYDPNTIKSQKFNHFNVKMKDYSTLMLTTKSLNGTKKLNTVE